MTDPRSVLVTGAAGAIGRAVCDHLASLDIAVTGLSLEGPLPTSCARGVLGDACDVQLVTDALADVAAVVHLAGIAHPTWGSPFEVYRTNVVSTWAVLSAAGAQQVSRVVAASSINASGLPFNPHAPLPAYVPIDEDLPTDLADAYSLSKFSGEVAAAAAARRWGTSVISLRFPLVKSAEVLRKASTRAHADPSVGVREGWAYLELGDATRAVHAALTRPISGAVVVGLTAADTLIDEPTSDLLDRWAPDVERRRPFIGRESVVDSRQARAVLGFSPRFSLHENRADHSRHLSPQWSGS